MTHNTFSIRAISPLFLAISFLALGYGIIFTFIGIYLKESGTTNASIGVINACFYLGSILASIFSQKIITNVGHIRSFATFASVMVVAFLMHAVFFNEMLWALLRFFSGFAFYALLIILESWLNEKSSPESRGTVLAIYSITFYLSTAVGQLFLNLGDNLKQHLFTIGSALILCSIIVISLTKIKEPFLEPFERYSFPKIYSVVPLAVTGSFLGGIFVSGFFTMFPIYILSKFDSLEVVSYFMIITLCGGLISQWPIGKLSDKYGRRKVISSSAFFTAFSSLLFIFSSSSIMLTYVCGFSLGMTIFSIYPLSLARANDVVDENKDIVEITRTLLFTNSIGSFLSPLLIGILSTYFEHSMFIMFFILNIFLAFYALSKEKVPDDDMSEYVNVPVVSGAELPQLDPRQDAE
ncbi:MFS transporter [Sulfurospirillum arcachonense]|uniref:MFS transporter n=1 Tax=Sulfurospirillum arcachonense TaxID=57666 RepID=UPI0004B48077|nr:MFS transporter [Sulfurospirillum arcachonense]